MYSKAPFIKLRKSYLLIFVSIRLRVYPVRHSSLNRSTISKTSKFLRAGADSDQFNRHMSKEVIAIKIPASTAASRKKLVKNVDQIEKTFSKKMIKFQTSQYVKAIEAAEENSQYSEDLEDEWAAKRLAAHVILTFEKMIKSAEMELR